MNWTIEQLRSFVAAAESGSFSAAGRALGQAQSVISTHISMLEDVTGIELFDRASRSPTLTKAGSDLLLEAKAVLRQSMRFDACAMAKYNGEADHLGIVIEQGMPFQEIAETLAVIQKKYPFLTGSLYLDTADRVRSMVSAGEAQMGLVFGDSADDIPSCEWRCLGQMQYCIVAAADSELGRKKKVTEQDLSQHCQILYRGERKYLLSARHWEVNNVFCAMYMASLGIGWTVVPRMVMQKIIEDGPARLGRTCILEMEQIELAVSNYFLIYNRHFSNSDILDMFREDLVRRCRFGTGK